jgi:hypothetical protein
LALLQGEEKLLWKRKKFLKRPITQMASQNIEFGLFGPGFLFWGEFLHFFDLKNMTPIGIPQLFVLKSANSPEFVPFNATKMFPFDIH